MIYPVIITGLILVILFLIWKSSGNVIIGVWHGGFLTPSVWKLIIRNFIQETGVSKHNLIIFGAIIAAIIIFLLFLIGIS